MVWTFYFLYFLYKYWCIFGNITLYRRMKEWNWWWSCTIKFSYTVVYLCQDVNCILVSISSIFTSALKALSGFSFFAFLSFSSYPQQHNGQKVGMKISTTILESYILMNIFYSLPDFKLFIVCRWSSERFRWGSRLWVNYSCGNYVSRKFTFQKVCNQAQICGIWRRC